MSDEKNRRILVIDDNRGIHEDFMKILAAPREADGLDEMERSLFGDEVSASREVYEIDSAYQGQEGLAKVSQSMASGRRYALAFVDMRMPPGWDGAETIEKIWAVDPEIQIVICTAYSDYSWEDVLHRFGAADRLLVLKKPFDTVEVCQLARALTEQWHIARRTHLKLSQLESVLSEQALELRAAQRRLEEEISERGRSEQARRTSEDRYALAAAAANDGLWDWDLAAGTVFYSIRWKSMLGLADGEISAAPREWFDRVHPDDLPRLEADIAAHLEGRTDHLSCEYRMRHKDGHYRWILCRGLASSGADGKAVRAAGSHTDTTGRKVAEEQLHHDAFHDPLTGLSNRALLMDRLERALLHARRDPDHHFAVLYLGLDRFKLINDSLGRARGDQLLIAVGKRLHGAVKDAVTSAAASQIHLARFGGDEFVLLLDGLRAGADASAVAERLQRSLVESFDVDGHEVWSSTSIGIALSKPGYERPEDILRDADIALYQSKGSGTGRPAVFDEGMHASTVARWRMENELRRALDRGELRLLYQPIMSLETGEVKELEALVRWQHPERGLITPDAFVPLAEATGLIVPLGYWVLREACAALRRWQDQVPHLENLAIGVNVSAKQFAQSDIVEEISRILKETGVKPSQLKLEITESAIMEDSGTTLAGLALLRDLDLQFRLDDFGTGYSSLSYLHRMPIDALKIDRSFVNRMTTDPMSGSIVRAVVALAHTLGMHVVAEGIETKDQLDQLRAMQCDAGQGFYLSVPLNPDQVLQLLAAK